MLIFFAKLVLALGLAALFIGIAVYFIGPILAELVSPEGIQGACKLIESCSP
ncbi:MAG: hypothetical protein UW88_C0021G0013 [Candidatus Collierbacteria bacterium GW2011_GWD2_45_10]|nr:MAG: hypothetical protein UW56_C0016G0001 [Candidatus Collierbacteria bacterium GW2011_GWD1_44_27]KKT87791.1 MAG: hypothetical protein UW88_C0021G0013 [Candidatus Collierbacteria bacterium GW2011_GWD2_45_10]